MSDCNHTKWRTFNGGKCCRCASCDLDPSEEIIRLQSEVERLRGRCGELESQPTVTQLSELMRGLQIGPGFATMPPYMFYVIGKKIADQASEATDAAILRKQAEAVEACEQEFQGQLGVIMTLSQYAERLRQQAAENENG